MTALSDPAIPRRQAGSPPFLPLLLILFVGSGGAALIYEVVWFQLLQFAIGSSAVSIAVLLGTFMGGMCLGSLLFSRFVGQASHPLRIYAFLELGIGLLGLAITRGLPQFESLYAALAHIGGAGITMRAIICAVCLLPPTILMGATLPAMSRWIENTPSGVAWLGFFYGGNTVGAVGGCLLAGFFLLPAVNDMLAATYVAAGINLFVAVIGTSLSFSSRAQVLPHQQATIRDAVDEAPIAAGAVYAAIALSGMAALGGEVIWTRLLSLLLAGTTYTFSIILAVFLAGLGIGSSVGAMIGKGSSHPRLALAWCQVLSAISVGWTAYAVTNGLPNWPVDPYLVVGQVSHFQFDLARCAWAVLPPTLFWGASFPLALAAMSANAGGGDPARFVGRVYAANTLGAIIGALFFSLIAIEAWGTQTAQHILIALAAVSAVCALLPEFMPETQRDLVAQSSSSLAAAAVSVFLALILPAAMIGILYIKKLDSVPWKLVAFGRRFQALDVNTPNDEFNNDHMRPLYVGEGMNSSVAVTESGTDTISFHVAGKVEASTMPKDMRLQLMLGHLPALFHAPADNQKVLIVGCGAGVTAGSFILYPNFKKIVICEIEPLVPQVVGKYFAAQNNDVVTCMTDGPRAGQPIDKRVQIVYDDARHYILTTDEKFDVITSDPIHPWVKGAACLYTRQYFELVKQHLNPGGIVTQWVPLYESDMASVKSEMKTFFAAFPNGTVWSNDVGGAGYDVLLMGSVEPMVIDEKALASRMNMLIAERLREVNLSTPLDILKSYGGKASDLAGWLSDGEINDDRNLRLQYLAGRALNDDQSGQIQNELVSHRRFDGNILHCSPLTRTTLEATWR